MSPVSAVIFDMDGVLVDSEPLWQRAEQTAFAAVGVDLTLAEILDTMGLRVDEMVAHHRARHGLPATLQHTLEAGVESAVIDLIRCEAVLLDGVTTALDAAADAGRRIGLCTSSSHAVIDAILITTGLTDRFETTTSASGLPYGKPHPEVYLRAAASLDTAPTACLAIEDSVNGVISAKAARMRCLAVPGLVPEHRRGAFAVADTVVATLADADWKELLS